MWIGETPIRHVLSVGLPTGGATMSLESFMALMVGAMSLPAVALLTIALLTTQVAGHHAHR